MDRSRETAVEFHHSVPWRNKSSANGAPCNRSEDNAGMRMATLSTPDLGKCMCNGTNPRGTHRISSLLNAQYVK
eukprot:4247426-Lingulodinium_polyedra.AAC.1